MYEKPIRVVARVVSLPDKTEELRSLLIALVASTRRETGCLYYDLLQNQSDPTDFTFVEEWESNAALESHLNSDHIKAAADRFPELLAEDLDIRRYDTIE